MSSQKTIRLLCEKSDLNAILPVLTSLRGKGIRIIESEKEFKSSDTVLAVLSEAFSKDPEKTDALLKLIGKGANNILPLKIDDAELPDALKNALFARNIIFSQGRDEEQIAERILSALPKKKNRLPLILAAAGAAVLIAAAILIWQAVTPKNANNEPEPTAAPTQRPQPVSLPFGLTAEDLEKITEVNIMGEEARFYTSEQVRKMEYLPEWDELGYRVHEDGEAHYFSREDGHEFRMTRYEDLSFISLMPNLQYLYLSLVECDNLPDLRSADRLRSVFLCETNLTNLDWLSGSSMTVIHILNGTGTVRGFGALSDCKSLRDVHIDLGGKTGADLTGFGPEKLEWLWINNASPLCEPLNLSDLVRSERLTECIFEYIPLKDLSCLKNAEGLVSLQMENVRGLTDISQLGSLHGIEELRIRSCRQIGDYTPVQGCHSLNQVEIQCEEDGTMLRDASFLSGLQNLREIRLWDCDLDNLDFLEGIAENRKSINLSLAGEIRDFSGLGFISRYDRLEINLYSRNISLIAPYIQNANINALEISFARNVDLSLLPDSLMELRINSCDIEDLKGIKNYALVVLELGNNRNLKSLEGIQNIRSLFYKSGGLNLMIENSPYLYDYSALNGASLQELYLNGLYILPEFDRFTVKSLGLEYIGGLKDLSALEKLSDSERYRKMTLINLDELTDLMPLRRFQIEELLIAPQLADQAEDLKRENVIWSYEIRYPEGGWNPLEEPLELRSLEDLETFPASFLNRIESLTVYGARVGSDGFNYWIEGDRNAKVHPDLYIHYWDADEPEKLEDGVITEIGMLKDLTGLKQLRLIGQPLTSLDGIQEFMNLEELEIAYCFDLKDASEVFALQGLKKLILSGTGITSIQGVQNLTDLKNLDICDTDVKSLEPLKECSFALADEGFILNIAGTDIADLTPLQSIPRYEELEIWGYDAEKWLPAVEGKEIRTILANVESNEALEQIVLQHPELSELHIQHSHELTDLTPLLSMENLRYVRVCSHMEQAIESLQGTGFGFELFVEQ